MKSKTYTLEILTPCFCGGANPKEKAEIRAPSIRGQLRWWFRVLGGFKSLAPRKVREQEEMIFGSTAGDHGRAGQLLTRIVRHQYKVDQVDSQGLGHRAFSDPAYLTFPIQSRERHGQIVERNARAVISTGSFDLQLIWKGSPAVWNDIERLVAVLAELGSLGFRGRRAMGSLRFKPGTNCPTLLLEGFGSPTSIDVRSAGRCSSDKQVVEILGRWLKRWRAHGRTNNNTQEQAFPGYKWAKQDHDIGAARLGNRQPRGPAFRPALGLPIVQFFSSARRSVQWEWGNVRGRGSGRFASPILLRPSRSPQGEWEALVIFVDAMRWPADKKEVFVDGTPVPVSLDLYDAMKADPNLRPFRA